MSIFLVHNKTQVSQICGGDKYPTIGAGLTELSVCISSLSQCPATDIILSSQVNISNGLMDPSVT